MTNEQLCDQIRARIQADPLFFPLVIDAIKGGMDAFRAAEKAKRGPLADMAVRELMVLGRFPKPNAKHVSYIVDAVYHQFPNGPTMHSPGEVEFWQYFLACARLRELDRGWLCDTRGRDCLEWWDRVVAPCLKTAEPSDA